MRTVDERSANPSSIIAEAIKNSGSNIRVAVPGIVQGWDKNTQTVKVQLAIREKVSFGGQAQEMEIPLLVDVPVVMPRIAGYSMLATPETGDECLVIFADMCIDAWWQSGGVQPQADKRRHDLSDGFAIMGVWSQPCKPQAFPEPSDGARFQNKQGTAGFQIRPDGKVNIFGSDILMNGASYYSHRHTGVESGSSTTGGVSGGRS